MKKRVFNLKRYTHDQLVDALLCPVNRDMTRREHSCDDEALWKNHGEWLIQHYIEFGGAEEWAKRREEYYEEREEEEAGKEEQDTDEPRGSVW